MLRPISLSALLAAACGAQAMTLKNWEDALLPLDDGAQAGIVAFAATIAEAFDETAHCAAGIRAGGASADGIVVQVKEKNGYISCEKTADNHTSEFAYWKRDDGHYLVALLVNEDTGAEDLVNRIYTYQVNAANTPLLLAPDSALSKRINKLRREDYIIRLPTAGKDLPLQQMEGAGGATHYLYWTGNGFADTVSTTAQNAAKKDAGKDAGKAQAKAGGKAKSDKPEAVVAIGRAYRAGKVRADEDATRLLATLNNVRANAAGSESKIEYIFAEQQTTPYFIYVHEQTEGRLSYEEYLLDNDGGKAELLFWFQKLEENDKVHEYRLYFAGGKVIYHDIRENGGKAQTGNNLPKKHPFGGKGGLTMQRDLQRYLAIFAAGADGQ